jgi:serine protease Do
VLKIDTRPAGRQVRDARALKPGQWVVAISSPFGFDAASAGIERTAALPTVFVPFIQTTPR